MAGQGVNLGFKDVKALQTVLAEAIGNGESWNNPLVIAKYEQKRRKDNLMMMTTMDTLYFSFSHVSPLAKFARNAALSLVNKVPLMKKKALAYACGI
jgi:2-octaprenyl-3-methyl-6-methoxy-1,4-benzoquinol hydroxylase